MPASPNSLIRSLLYFQPNEYVYAVRFLDCELMGWVYSGAKESNSLVHVLESTDGECNVMKDTTTCHIYVKVDFTLLTRLLRLVLNHNTESWMRLESG